MQWDMELEFGGDTMGMVFSGHEERLRDAYKQTQSSVALRSSDTGTVSLTDNESPNIKKRIW